MNQADPMLDGDRTFTGWNAALSPESLPAGKLALSVNNRLRSGAVERRAGVRKTGWWNPGNYPFQAASAQSWIGTLTQGMGTVTPGGSWTDPETGTVHTAADRRVGWTLSIESGPATGASIVGWYILWPDGLIQIVRNWIDATTLIVDDYQGFDVAAPTSAPFAMSESNLLGKLPALQASTVIHAGHFSDPNGLDWDVRLTESAAWLARPGYEPWSVAIGDGGIAPGDNVFLLQCFERLLLFRGEGKDVLEWDGSETSSFIISEYIPPSYLTPGGGSYLTPGGGTYLQPESNDFTEQIPGASRALFFGNRVWVLFERDNIAVSDVASYTRYDYLANEFRLNEGTSDEGVALHPFGRRSILVFFQRSIYLLENIFGDLTEMTARRISTKIGCGGAETISDVGDNVWWADIDGQVWSISQVDDDRMELTGRPISWPMHPDMRAQSCGRVDLWRAAYHDGQYLLATTTYAGAGGPVYVFDTIVNDWVSRDMLEPVNMPTLGLPRCLGWLFMSAYGEQRLLYQSAYHSCIYGYGLTDNIEGHDFSINQQIRTRAVSTLPLQDKRIIGARLQVRTLNPSFSIEAVGQGVNQQQVLASSRSFNRLAYTAWGKDEFIPDNRNFDYFAPHREDYLALVSDGLNQFPQPFDPNPLQEWRMVYPVRALAESIQLEVRNGQRPVDSGSGPAYSYIAACNKPTGITLAAWRIDAHVAGHSMQTLT